MNEYIPPFEIGQYKDIILGDEKYLDSNNSNIFFLLKKTPKKCLWIENTTTFHIISLSSQSAHPISKITYNIAKYDENKHQIPSGSMIYGSFLEDRKGGGGDFIIEDVFYYKGTSLKNISFSYKLGIIEKIIEKKQIRCNDDLFGSFSINLFLCRIYSSVVNIPIFSTSEYSIKEITICENDTHIFNANKIVASINIQKPNKNIFENAKEINTPVQFVSTVTPIHRPNRELMHPPQHMTPPPKQFQKKNISTPPQQEEQELVPKKMYLYKPQYNFQTIFKIKADIQYDIYHLYVCGKKNGLVYYGVASIPDLKTSVFMNKLFRNIKENKNIDFIEESDDEEDFEDIDVKKYVIPNKFINMKCKFDQKYKKWIPLSMVPEHMRIVHISML